MNWDDMNGLLGESHAVEWKRNVADEEDVVRTLCAFANDIGQLGGGRVLCGIEEVRDADGTVRPRVIGVDSNRTRELAHKVPALCRDRVYPPLVVRTSIVPVPGGDGRAVVVFEVNSSRHAHGYKNRRDEMHYWIRMHDRTERTNGRQEELLRLKGVFPALMQSVAAEAAVEDLDVFALREFLGKLGLPQPVERYLDPDFRVGPEMPSLVTVHGGSPRPRNFAVLLFGKDPSLYLAGAFVTITIYEGLDRAATISDDSTLRGPVPVLYRECLSRLQVVTSTTIDKAQVATSGLQNRPRFSRRAIEEALVNALVHRDYASAEPVKIHAFDDRLEISSPGGITHTISPAHFERGEAPADWRNPELAHALFILGLAQRRGQGIPTIIRETERVSGHRPAMRLEPGHVTIILPAATRLRRPHTADPWVATAKDGLILISIGGASIRNQVEASLPSLGLAEASVMIDLAEPGYVSAEHWDDLTQRIKDQIRRVIDDPEFVQVHLFYRGPVALAALIGALFAGAKKLIVYNYEEGRYSPVYTIDRRFLKG